MSDVDTLDPGLLAAAMSAMMDRPVITYEEYQSNPSYADDFQELNFAEFFDKILPAPSAEFVNANPRPASDEEPNPEPEPSSTAEPSDVSQPGPNTEQPPQTAPEPAPSRFTLFVRTLKGTTITLSVLPTDTIRSVKEQIEGKEHIPIDEQRVIYGGKFLKDDLALRDYNIEAEATFHLSVKMPGGGRMPGLYLPQHLLYPAYDYDFTHKHDGQQFSRGSGIYERPCGWMRFALNTRWLYPGNEAWLGRGNWWPDGAWCVSYHGTARKNARSIAEKGYQLSFSRRELYGKGIYSTPYVRIAEKYAHKYSYHGRKYKIIFQNRVHPTRTVWVGPTGKQKYYLSYMEGDIRACGICIKRF